MSGLVSASLRTSRLLLAVAVGVVLIGVTQLASAKVDYLPDFMPPSVQIQTEALGLSAAEVEQLVTVPLEQDLLNGVPWLDHIHSRSQPGLSAIDVVFENGTDLYAARQMVQERLTQAHALPNVGSPPVMVEPLASVSRVAMIGMSSNSVSLIDMSVLARWKVRPTLMGIPGVANVSIYGMRDRQLQVEVDPARLKAAGVNLTQVIDTAGNALWVSPLTFVEASTPGTGGFIEGANQRLAVQHVLPITTAQSLGQVAVEGAPTPLRLGDVTQVVEDHQPLIGDSVSPTPTLYLVVQKFPGADTVAVTKAVDEAMASLAPGLGGITVDNSIYRPATFLESAARTVSLAGALMLLALLTGAALVFWTWRLALVVVAAALTTVVATLYALHVAGATLTSMTLGGVLVATVVVISQVAVAAEDLARQRAAEPEGARDLLVATLARSQVSAAVGALVCGLLVVPALFLDPLTTAFTRAAALAFGLAVAVGTVVGIAVVPATAGAVRAGPVTRSPVRDRFGAIAERVPGRAGGRLRTIGVAAVLLLVGLSALPQLGSPSLVPAAQDRNLLVRLDTLAGTSLTEMDRITGSVADRIRQVPGVAQVGGHVGRAIGSDQLGDVNGAEVWVAMSADADYAATRSAVGAVVRSWAGVAAHLDTYPSERIASVEAAGGHDLVVRLFGQDLTALQQTAGTVASAVGGLDHVRDARVQPIPRQPTVAVEVDLAAARKYGLRPGDVRREATTLASGLTVGNLYQQAQIFDVVVRGTQNVRSDLTGLSNLQIGTPDGGSVRLGDVAKVTVTAQPASIVHDQVLRSVDVVARIDGDVASVVDAVRARVGSMPMPPEAHVEVLSAAQDRRTDLVSTLAVAAAVLVAVLLVLQALFGSWRRAALLMLVSPLGLAGAAAVAPLVGGLGTVGPLLAGIAAVMLVLVWGIAVLRGSASRSGPGVAAVLVAVTLVPAALVGSGPGTELLRPFAITMLGGLVSALAVVLLVVPAFAGRPEGELA